MWTNNVLQDYYLNADNVDDGIVKMEELKVALKRKENYLAKVT